MNFFVIKNFLQSSQSIFITFLFIETRHRYFVHELIVRFNFSKKNSQEEI